MLACTFAGTVIVVLPIGVTDHTGAPAIDGVLASMPMALKVAAFIIRCLFIHAFLMLCNLS